MAFGRWFTLISMVLGAFLPGHQGRDEGQGGTQGRDDVLPVISAFNLTSSGVDSAGQANIAVSAQISDNRCLQLADIEVTAVAKQNGMAVSGAVIDMASIVIRRPTAAPAALDKVEVTGSLSVSGLPFCNIRVSVTISARDCSILPLQGNLATAANEVDVSDTTPPAAAALPDIRIGSRAAIPSPAVTPAAFQNLGSQITETVTSLAALRVESSDALYQGGDCDGSLSRTYRIIDACGNTGTFAQTILVHDGSPPTAALPADKIRLTVSCRQSIPAPATNVSTFLAIGVGAALSNDVANVSAADRLESGTDRDGTINRTYTIADACGNTIEVVQRFVIKDSSSPQATAPPDASLQKREQIPAAATTVAEFIRQGGVLDDECTPSAELSVSAIDGPLQGTEYRGQIVRLYTIRDASGNTVTKNQVFTFGGPVPWPHPTGGPNRMGAAGIVAVAEPWASPRHQRYEEYKPNRGIEGYFAVKNHVLVGQGGILFLKCNRYMASPLPTQQAVAALNPVSREFLWWFPVADGYVWSPAIDPDGTVFVYDGKGVLTALDPITGQSVWKSPRTQPNPALPVVGDILAGPDGRIFAACGEKLLAFGPPASKADPARTLLWEYSCLDPRRINLGDSSYKPSLSPQGNLIVLHRLESLTNPYPWRVESVSPAGVRTWAYDLPGGILRPSDAVIAADGTIYVIIEGGYLNTAEKEFGALLAITKDGALRWRKPLPEIGDRRQITPPVIGADGKLFFLTRTLFWEHGEIILHAVEPSSGADAWTAALTDLLAGAGVAEPDSVVKAIGELHGSAGLIDAAGAFFVRFHGGNDVFVFDTKTRRIRNFMPRVGWGPGGNMALDGNGRLYFAGDELNGGGGSCTGTGNSSGIIALIPRSPLVCSLRLVKRAFKINGTRITVEAEFETVVEDPRGETDLLLSVDFGDGQTECYNNIRTQLQTDGRYRATFSFRHRYDRMGDFNVAAAFFHWERKAGPGYERKNDCECSLPLEGSDRTPPAWTGRTVCEVTETSPTKTRTLYPPGPEIFLNRTGSAVFRGTAADDAEGCGLWKIQYRVGTGPWLDAQGKETWTFSVALTAADQAVSTYEVHIQARDYAGNLGTEIVQTLICDRRRPYIADLRIAAPAPGTPVYNYRVGDLPTGATTPILMGQPYHISFQVVNPHPQWTFNIGWRLQETKWVIKWAGLDQHWKTGFSAARDFLSMALTPVLLSPGQTAWITQGWMHDWNWIPEKGWFNLVFDIVTAYIPFVGEGKTAYDIFMFLSDQSNALVKTEWLGDLTEAKATPPPGLGLDTISMGVAPVLIRNGSLPIRTVIHVSDSKQAGLIASFETSIAANLATAGGMIMVALINPVSIAVGIALLAAEGYLIIGSAILYDMAFDPSPEYTKPVVPRTIPCPEVEELKDRKGREAALSAVRLVEQLEAFKTAMARHFGALKAGDREWAVKQARAASGFARSAAVHCGPIRGLLETAAAEIEKLDAPGRKKLLADWSASKLPTIEERILKSYRKFSSADIRTIASIQKKMAAETLTSPRARLAALDRLKIKLEQLASDLLIKPGTDN